MELGFEKTYPLDSLATNFTTSPDLFFSSTLIAMIFSPVRVSVLVL
jgi:hypothetical protein